MASASIGGSPSTIQSARKRPAPPPSITPMLEPVSSHALSSPKAGPTSGFASGVNVIGPLTTVLMPACASAGTRSMAIATMGSTRSRSGGSSSMPNSGGMPSTPHGRPSAS